MGHRQSRLGFAEVIHVVEPQDGNVWPHATQSSGQNQIPDTPDERGGHGQLEEGLDSGRLGDVVRPSLLLQPGFVDSAVKVFRHDDVPENVERPLLHGVAKLDQTSLSARVVDEQDDVRPPKLDVLWLQAQQIFPDLVVYEILRHVTPPLRRAKIVDQQEEEDENTDGNGRVGLVDEEHGHGRREAAHQSRLPVEELEARSKIWRRPNLEEETREVHDEEGHL